MKPLIKDGQSLESATIHGHPLRVYDDGYGPLWIHRDSMGVTGIVRAQTWEDAYSICEDEFFSAATETEEEFEREYSTEYMSGRKLWLHENSNSWEAWKALSHEEKEAAYRLPGKDVPFDSSNGKFTEHPCWQEAYGFRSNPRKEEDGTYSSIYAKDLNGDRLDQLTEDMLKHWDIKLEIKDEETYEPPQRYFSWHFLRRPLRGRVCLACWAGRYETKSNVFAGYRGSMKYMERYSHYAPRQDDSMPDYNPDGHIPELNPRIS